MKKKLSQDTVKVSFCLLWLIWSIRFLTLTLLREFSEAVQYKYVSRGNKIDLLYEYLDWTKICVNTFIYLYVHLFIFTPDPFEFRCF